MKITLVAFFDTNLGEMLIQDSTVFLIKRAAEETDIDAEISIHGLFWCEDNMYDFKSFRRKIARTGNLIVKKLNLPDSLRPVIVFFEEAFAILNWHFQTRTNPEVIEYYKNIVTSADIVVTAGGGILSHFNLNVWAPFYALLTACEKAKTPLYINCIGIEKPSSAFSLFFRFLFSKKCIKHITVRDDIKTAQKHCPKRVGCQLAGDPALWISECYGIEKSQSEIIGINVIRPDIFLDNDGKLTPDEVKTAYINIINNLLSRGYNVQLFTNGTKRDEDFAKILLDQSNLSGNLDFLAPCPKTGQDLVKTISSYRGIVGARMHCAIAAVSLDIPCIEVLWKPKQVHFARLINRTEWFFPENMFQDADFVIDLLEKALGQGYDRDVVENLKNKALENIRDYLF